jgi:hypothetical protein
VSLITSNEFSPVWISSILHINEFRKIFDGSSRWIKYITARYKIPEGFPHIKVRLSWIRYPIVFFSNGILTVTKDELSFKTYSYRIFFGILYNFCNISSDLIFHLKPDDGVAIERYKYPKPPVPGIGNYYNIEWIRLKSNGILFADDILICVGGNGLLMGKIRKKTDHLYTTLLDFQNQ